MVHVELARSNHHLAAIAGDLAERLNADIIGIAACQPVKPIYDEAFTDGEVVVANRMEIDRELKVAKAAFRRDLAPHCTPEWRGAVTYLSLSDYIARQARAADLVITGPDIGGVILDSTHRVNIADLVMEAGRPVLIVPRKCKSLPLKNALVAWKNTREARRALHDALPILQICEQVHVAAVAPEAEFERARQELSDVVRWLAKHDVAASHDVYDAHGPDSSRLAEISADLGADLVVAGAYGHSRLQEWLLGGVTYDLLLNPKRCVLVSH